MMNVSECAAFLASHDDYLIVTHCRPDGDTLGSAAALCAALRRQGKTARLFPNPEITPKYSGFVSGFITGERNAQTVVAVDAAEERMFCEGFSGRVDLCIDHHPTNPGYAVNNLIRGERSACGEIVLELIEAMCGGITATEAELLYVAVSTDTGGFRYANVNADTFAAASRIAAAGADIRSLNYKLFRETSKARLLLEGEICSAMRFYADGRLVIAPVTLEMLNKCGAVENDCDDIAGIPGRVEGCAVSILVRELEPGVCKASLRSRPGFDSAAIALKFGGGGHVLASGCTVRADVETCCDMLAQAVLEKLS